MLMGHFPLGRLAAQRSVWWLWNHTILIRPVGLGVPRLTLGVQSALSASDTTEASQRPQWTLPLVVQGTGERLAQLTAYQWARRPVQQSRGFPTQQVVFPYRLSYGGKQLREREVRPNNPTVVDLHTSF